MKKKIIAATMAAAMCVSLAACGGSTASSSAAESTASSTAESTASSTADAASTGDEEVDLRMAWWGSQDRHDRTIKAIELYESLHPNVKIEYEYYSFDDYFTKLKTLVASDQVWDIFQLGGNFPMYMDKMRYADAPDPWEEETPPQGCTAVPIASMDVMSYSYACRETLAEIARISGDAEAQAQWAAKAKAVQDKMVSYLWDDARGAMFDRDKNHNQMPTLIHNTLRCMYWHSLPDALAERFVKEHLLNPQEFWTKMPLPSVAANDPLFRNVTTNNWSGQAEALTYQRAIRALENYGMYELIPQLGQKLMQAIGPQCRFVQQYDPFTGEPSVICEPGQPPQDAYGPAMLSVLEYTARMYGVSLVRDTVVWGTCPLECRYTQALNGRSWEIVNSGHEAEAFVDGRKVFTAGPGLRITTDLDGNILGTARYLPDADPAQVTPQ